MMKGFTKLAPEGCRDPASWETMLLMIKGTMQLGIVVPPLGCLLGRQRRLARATQSIGMELIPCIDAVGIVRAEVSAAGSARAMASVDSVCARRSLADPLLPGDALPPRTRPTDVDPADGRAGHVLGGGAERLHSPGIWCCSSPSTATSAWSPR